MTPLYIYKCINHCFKTDDFRSEEQISRDMETLMMNKTLNVVKCGLTPGKSYLILVLMRIYTGWSKQKVSFRLSSTTFNPEQLESKFKI